MKKIYKIGIPFLALFILISSFTAKKATNDPEKDRVLITVINYMLTNGHYLPKDLDDAFSEKVFYSFIDGLDPSKRYFTQLDIADFEPYKYQIDNQLKKADLTFYNAVFSHFSEKVKSAKKYYGQILARPFDFSKKEVIDVDYKKIPFAKNENELIDYWRKQLKLNVLGRIQEAQKLEEEKVKDDKNFKFKATPFKTLEENARKEVLKSMDELYIRIEELNHTDWFSTFLNSVVSGFDPHSTYMAPNIKEKFDVDMSGKIEGIGARLQKKGLYTHVTEVISGGPAWKQGELEADDIILKVAQSDEKEPVEIVGMRLDDAIKFIKGKKGTEVKLTVKKKLDGSIKVISIIRDIVNIDETFVKSSIVTINGEKFGLIDLPQFYIDFSGKTESNSAVDMEKEIANLKKEGVKGLLIDLRNNGGGSLKTAIQISGLFIDKGPIVQVKNRNEKPMILDDEDSKIQWNGPLVILVNEFSASASEIFAAAMQDYNRAVIIGGNQTYGKGTVQNILPINQFYPKYDKDLGFLKMTIQKFYRVNGGSTQKEGVYSDIAMPSRYSFMKFGERDLDDALEWDKVDKANYTSVNSYSNFNDVVSNSKQRIMKNPKFKLIYEYAKWLKEGQDKTSYSLNYKQFTKDNDTFENNAKKYSDAFKFDSHLTFVSPKSELPLLQKDSVIAGKRDAWHKNLSKDIYVTEALTVLSELKMKEKTNVVKN